MANKGFGCGWVVIVVVAILLIFSVASGEASWDAINSLLDVGFLVFLFVRWIST